MIDPAGGSSRKLLILNGPNLNLLGTREPHIYGADTLADVEKLAADAAETRGMTVECFQSNHEGALIDAVHAARGTAAGIVINPGGFTHTSVALRDALSGVDLPVVEVHISNVHRREEFRHHSYISGIAEAVIAGAGISGYRFAIELLADRV
ncbi:type II 3-dehydroquinate dehydratase [Arthrobacter crystallopoietes]|jgi:3-dehydroquinate dehydratase-2|uniref:type II 3-dehydroquinate dehydratase n=1 Tax=Crystallibacter crystallopoietes TaxID=37928 RepID=UPI003D197B96